MVLHCGERSWKSRNGDSDVGVGEGGRDRTEVVHHRQTSYRTEENIPVGAAMSRLLILTEQQLPAGPLSSPCPRKLR